MFFFCLGQSILFCAQYTIAGTTLVSEIGATLLLSRFISGWTSTDPLLVQISTAACVTIRPSASRRKPSALAMDCVRYLGPFIIIPAVTIVLSIIISVIVKDSTDDPVSLTFSSAFIDSLPWGAGSAAVWLMLYCVATHNIGGTSALALPFFWCIIIVFGVPILSLFITLMFLLALNELIPPILFGLMSVSGAAIMYNVYDPDFED